MIAYSINRGPSVPLSDRLLKEVSSGKEVNLCYLRVFSCISYVHIDSDARINYMLCLENVSLVDMKTRPFIIGFGMIKTERSLEVEI
jgi:hypothetical protein